MINANFLNGYFEACFPSFPKDLRQLASLLQEHMNYTEICSSLQEDIKDRVCSCNRNNTARISQQNAGFHYRHEEVAVIWFGYGLGILAPTKIENALIEGVLMVEVAGFELFSRAK